MRLFELWTTTEGPGAAPADRAWSYAGPTIRCRLHFRRLGGFPTESRWRTEEREILRMIHFASIGGEWLPVRVEISAPLGAVVARVRFDGAETAAD